MIETSGSTRIVLGESLIGPTLVANFGTFAALFGDEEAIGRLPSGMTLVYRGRPSHLGPRLPPYFKDRDRPMSTRCTSTQCRTATPLQAPVVVIGAGPAG